MRSESCGTSTSPTEHAAPSIARRPMLLRRTSSCTIVKTTAITVDMISDPVAEPRKWPPSPGRKFGPAVPMSIDTAHAQQGGALTYTPPRSPLRAALEPPAMLPMSPRSKRQYRRGELVPASDGEDSDGHDAVLDNGFTAQRRRQHSSNRGTIRMTPRTRQSSSNSIRLPRASPPPSEARVSMVDGGGQRDLARVDLSASASAKLVINADVDCSVELVCVPIAADAERGVPARIQWEVRMVPSKPIRSVSPLPPPLSPRSPVPGRAPPRSPRRIPITSPSPSDTRTPSSTMSGRTQSPFSPTTPSTPRRSRRLIATDSPTPSGTSTPSEERSMMDFGALDGLGLDSSEPSFKSSLVATTLFSKASSPATTPGSDWHGYDGYLDEIGRESDGTPRQVDASRLRSPGGRLADRRKNAQSSAKGMRLDLTDLARAPDLPVAVSPARRHPPSHFSDTEAADTEGTSDDAVSPSEQL